MADREILETDVLIVGGGPAGLACAIALMDKLKAANVEKPAVFLIEKGVSIGAHSLSGAVMDPRALNELIPDWKEQNAPVRQAVTQEEILLLTRSGSHSLPHFMIPPYLHNDGNYIVSLQELTAWLADQARSRGVEILEGVAGAELVMEGSRVLGVRCGDTGIGKDGQQRSNYLPGTELRAKVTILAEGVRGSLSKALIKTLNLSQNKNPQIYALGVKEVWELPSGTFPAGKVIHTLGYPLQNLAFGGIRGFDRSTACFGGSWVYGLTDTLVSIGLVVGLDYSDPTVDPHNEFNRLKSHPYFQKLLEKGKLLHYGAKAIPEGGYYSMPRFFGDGFLICGDSASFLNAARLKGVHMALKSGMLAAETIVEALLKQDFSQKQLAGYGERFEKSWAREELYSVRNWRQSYAKGLPFGSINDMVMRISGGRGVAEKLSLEPDCATLHKKSNGGGPRAKPDGKITFDKMSDVYLSGTNHDEDQPCHLKVPDLNLCVERCTVEYGNPCQYFCPAGVYEWLKPESNAAPADGKPLDPRGRLHINAGNCVHCKTCDIKDPYENILWVTPEGGGGPRYQKM